MVTLLFVHLKSIFFPQSLSCIHCHFFSFFSLHSLDQDGAEPSPNSVSCMNLLRLSYMLDCPEWSTMAERIIRVFAARINRVPEAVPELMTALMFSLATPKQVLNSSRLSIQ